MANLFQDNAYNILGLDTSATQKDINKRAKEIINFLRIDEVSNYETDLNLVDVNRKESTVKDAVQKLSSPTKRIKEYFFWFDVENDADEKAIKLIKEDKIDDAIELWETHAAKDTAVGFVAKKNLAIVSSLLLLRTGQKKYLNKSLGYWEDIVLVDKFWTYFEKLYALNDEVGTSKAALDDFSKKATDDLSDFYTDVSEIHKDRSYYSLFSQLFAVKGQRLQKDVLSPIYEAIHDASETLRTLNISEDNIISEDEIKTVKSLLRKLQDNFGKLKELGLYDDSQSKTMRDKAAEAIRTVALDIYINLYESAKPAALLQAAEKLAGTPGTQQKIARDRLQIRKNLANEKIIIPINDLMEDEHFTQALDKIETLMQKHKNDKELNEYFNTRIKWCVTGIASKDFVECMEQFNANKFEQAQANFSGLKDFVLSYIAYFNFDKESLQGVLDQIEALTEDAGTLNLENVQNYRNQIIDGAPDSFKEEFEEMILIVLIDSSIYANLSTHLPAIRRNKLIKKWVWYIIIGIIVVIWGIAGSSSDSSSSTDTTSGDSTSSGSSSNEAYQTCSDQYDSLKSQLDSIESTMNQYKTAGQTDSYNALVPQQNDLVNQANAKATECNSLR